MLAYTLKRKGDTRVVTTTSKALMRYAFKSDGVPLEFEAEGSTLMAVATAEVEVYKKPHPSTFHREFMKIHSRLMHLGYSGADDKYVMEGMLELEETV